MAALFFWESKNLKIETDILESMPHNDPVLSDARQVIKHLPGQDKVFINLEQTSTDRDHLVKTALALSDRLNKSGLFTKVGIGDDAKNFPELMVHVHDNLPSLLSADDMETKNCTAYYAGENTGDHGAKPAEPRATRRNRSQ